MEYITLAIFCALLFLCLKFNISIVAALAAGLILFWIYGLCKGYTLREVFKFSIIGVKTVKNILLTFMLIGMLTAVWRAAGTISVIVCLAAEFIHPSVFLLMTFLLNCLISVLTGTAFGTAATMGVICSTMGASMGVSPMWIGGAVLAGVYFGDRCSPVSTSALLVATLTETNLFDNIKKMIHTAIFPFIVSCGIYLIVGIKVHGNGEVPDLTMIFGREFVLSLLAVLPAAVLLLLSLKRIDVKITMTISIVIGLGICLFVQNMHIVEIPKILLMGFIAKDKEIGTMINGGGIVSMLKVATIVCISSAYSGIFQNTGLLTNIQTAILKVAGKTTSFFAMLLTAILTGMIACNQTLSIMLTAQLTKDVETDKERLAINLENTAVIISPLIPWSIANAVVLGTIGVPVSSAVFGSFLYFLPVCQLMKSLADKKRACSSKCAY